MKTIYQLLFGCCLIFFVSCGGEEKQAEIERPHSPWVFRSVMDSMPRMITLALHDNLWVSYSAERGLLYKVWKGSVNFDGAVYTTLHGPQPSSLGNSWFENNSENSWKVRKGGKEIRSTVQYRGHQIGEGRAQLNYELVLEDGTKIQVSEQPEYISNKSGQTGFERTFQTKNVPEGIRVSLMTNLTSIASEHNLKYDGDFQIEAKKEVQLGGVNGLEITGELVLNSNASTNFTCFFTQKPFIENKNKVVGAEEEEERPLGYRLIAKNDCKTCHNTFVSTVGPAYMSIAKKYRNTPENVTLLTGKVINGGSGVWGAAPMSAHPDVAEADIKVMVEYVMNLDSLEEAKMLAIENSRASEDLDFQAGVEGLSRDDLFPGAIARAFIYDRDLNKLADIEPKPDPVFEGISPAVFVEQSLLKELPDNFAIVFEGYLNIPANNNYVFRLISDDGSQLYIDDKLIIDHDGLHGAGPKDGEIALSAGFHPFRVDYFQGKGGKSISLKWKSFNSGSDDFELVPVSAFVYHENDKPSNAISLAKEVRVSGDGVPVKSVHPSYDLSQARPEIFLPKVGGMDFLSDGRLVVSTWDAAGAVYIVEGANTGDPAAMTAKKIAEGLAEPLGLKVVDDQIYVLQKQELTKLIDHNGDEVIDEYYTMNNSWSTTGNFHEFAFGLVYKEGYFYGNLAIAILPGGASANPQAPDRGKTFRISKEDGSIEFVTHGLRTPNGIGIGVDDEIFISDNQGDWLPSSKILHVTPGAFFNSRAVDFDGTADLPVKQPVVWLPQDEIGNSPTTPLALNDGPYQGQMIHGEITNGGVKRVFVEKINGEYQGCVFRFIQGLEAAVNRLAWGPDGALYAGGIGSTGNWQDYEKLWYGLQRMKYNGNSTFEMLAVRAKSNGIEIEFTEALEDGIGWDANAYQIEQWWYLPTYEYGGPKMDKEPLKVLSANVSSDRKKVFLELEGMKNQHVIYVRLPNNWLGSNGEGLWSTETWYTMNNIPQNQMGERTTIPPATPNNTLSEAEKEAGWKLLFDGTTTSGWRNFKKETIGSSWKVEDGALMLDVVKRENGGWQAEDGGDIITDKEYQDFDLKLEWKIQDCGNSGIIYNVVESDKYDYVWQTGPEMQVLDNACHPDAKIVKHRAGDLYDMISCKYETVKKAGEWNQARIRIKNGLVEFWLNGERVVEFQMFDDNWRSMIANSKFIEMPDFGKAKKGHISLQDHGDRVWYKNIKIKEL